MTKECSITGCPNPSRRRGWCPKHYNRWKRHGDPEFVLLDRESDATTKFAALVTCGPRLISAPEMPPCQLWTGNLSPAGYGKFYPAKGVKWLAHRYAWTTAGLLIPDGMELAHFCHTIDIAHCTGGKDCLHRRCVELTHLEVVTHAENGHRARRGFCGRGHSLSGANLYEWGGQRYCRTCRREALERHRKAIRLMSGVGRIV
jgi:hypothetical protein